MTFANINKSRQKQFGKYYKTEIIIIIFNE